MSTTTTTHKWPDFIMYCLYDGSEVFVLPAKMYDEAVDVATEAFPGKLDHVSPDRIRFSIIIAELKTRITPPMWAIVIGAIGTTTSVYVDIKPEPEENDPPAYHTVAATPSDGENQSVIILLFDKDNCAFVAPGSTFDETIQIAKATFPSALHHIPDHRLSFSLKWTADRKIQIMPSAWGSVMSAYGVKKSFSTESRTIYTVYVHIQPEGGPAQAGTRPPGYACA